MTKQKCEKCGAAVSAEDILICMETKDSIFYDVILKCNKCKNIFRIDITFEDEFLYGLPFEWFITLKHQRLDDCKECKHKNGRGEVKVACPDIFGYIAGRIECDR